MFDKGDRKYLLLLYITSKVAAQATVTSTQSISLPTTRPQNAYEVPGDFPSVGFELGFVPGFNDDFSSNLIDELSQRMSEKPIVRVGGTSGDIIKYNPGQSEPHVCLKDGASIVGQDIFNNCSHLSEFILGPSFFDAFTDRYQSARISIQAPLDPIHSDNLPNKTNVVSFIKEAYKSLGAERIDTVAIGNEPNFYESDGLSYVRDGLSAAKDITEGVNATAGQEKIWEILDTASEVNHGKAPWPHNLKNMVDAWEKDDKRIKYIAEHYYQFDGKTVGMEEHLLNHTDLVEGFKLYQDNIDFTRNVAKAEYILSEAGGPLGPKFEETGHFAISLWGVNFMMYGMSSGVSRASLVQRPGVIRALWTPFAVKNRPGPMVQAQYYTYPFIADFLGKNISGKRGVVNIDLKNPVLSAYAMFEGDKLARIAIVNLRAFDGTGERKAVKVSLKCLDESLKHVNVGRLHADEGTAAGGWDVNQKNITWQGQQWSYAVGKGRAEGNMVLKELDVTNRTAEVVVPDSEAVIVRLG